MVYRFFADLTLVVHLGFILFAMLGGLFALRWRWAPLVHLPAAAWGVTIEWTRGICPLTPLENWLRVAGGRPPYQRGFTEHYLTPIVYPSGLTVETQFAAGIGLALINVAIYVAVLRRTGSHAGRIGDSR